MAFILNCTQKLLDRIKPSATVPDGATGTLLGNWYATVLIWKPHVALLVNQKTLLPVLMPLAPATDLAARFPACLAGVLTAHDMPQQFIDHEISQMNEVQYAKTSNRSVVGIMNQFTYLAEGYREHLETKDLLTLSIRLSETPCSPLYKSAVSPDRELRRLASTWNAYNAANDELNGDPTMKHAVNQIRGKKPYEIYTPAGANKDGHTDRDAFEQIAGNTNFHSFQVWRSKADGRATTVYALTLEQIKAINTKNNREIGGLKGRITKLLREVERLLPMASKAERLDAENKKLAAMKDKASVLLKEYKAKEAAQKSPRPPTILAGQGTNPVVGDRSLTGIGSGGLCADAVSKTDEYRGTVRG